LELRIELSRVELDTIDLRTMQTASIRLIN